MKEIAPFLSLDTIMPGYDAWRSSGIFQSQGEVVWSVKGNTQNMAEQKVGKNMGVADATGPLNKQSWDVPALKLLWNNKCSLWFNPDELESSHSCNQRPSQALVLAVGHVTRLWECSFTSWKRGGQEVTGGSPKPFWWGGDWRGVYASSLVQHLITGTPIGSPTAFPPCLRKSR